MLSQIQVLARRSFSSTANLQLKNRVKEHQRHFQRDDGVPLYLKGGWKDVVLYRFTMGLAMVGVGLCIYEIIKMSFPQKKK